MDKDYRLPELEDFINQVLNPVHTKSTDLMQRYRRFHAVVYYFEYTVGMVRSQEVALQNKETDAMICGNAVAAYIFMHDCFVLLESALNGISRDKSLAGGIRRLKKLYKPLQERVEGIRHSLGAHPEGLKLGTDIATKRTMISSDGRVRIGKFLLHPRKDLEELRRYADGLGGLFMKASLYK